MSQRGVHPYDPIDDALVNVLASLSTERKGSQQAECR